MRRIQVEDGGLLEFPADATDAEIDRGVEEYLAEKQRPAGVLRRYLPSVARTGEIYKEEYSAGLEAMKKMVEKPSAKTLVSGGLGAAQYAFSPLTAFAKGIFREPVEESLERAGVPKGIAQFAGEMTETGVYFVPWGKAVQTATVAQKSLAAQQELRAIETAGKMAKVAAAKPKKKLPLEFPKELPVEMIEEAITPISPAHRKILRTQVVEDIAGYFKTKAGEKWIPPEQRRLTQEIIDHIVAHPDEIMKVAEKYNRTPIQLAAEMKETMTRAGRSLNRMSQLAKELRAQYDTPYMRKLTTFLEEEMPTGYALDKFSNIWRSAENVRRAALVSQFATTARNITTQAGNLCLGVVNEAFQGAANAYLKSVGQNPLQSIKSTLRGFGEGLDILMATANRLSRVDRVKLTELLSHANAVEAKAKLFTTPIQDVVLTSRFSRTLNTFNTMQEYFFRNIAFEAKLRQMARKAGLDLDMLTGKDIPERMFTEAAEYALQMTYAAMPKSQFGKDMVRLFSHPLFTSFFNPFPRFLWGNAVPFLLRFSPIRFLEAFRPSVIAEIASGHPERFTKAVSEATLGTLMLNFATYIRNSEYGGPLWYQIKVGDKAIDTRAFAPFSTYLFLAEAMTSPERLKAADWFKAMMSVNRIAGTGLVLTDVFRGKNIADTAKLLSKLMGAYIGGFTVPARPIKDIYSTIDPQEALYRDVRENLLLGPAMQNIPKLSQIMPEARSPLRVGPLRTPVPMLRQFTGLSVQVRNALEQEIDKIQLDWRTVYPSTGNPEVDRLMSEYMAPVLEKAFPLLKQKFPDYTQLDNTTKRVIMGQLFKEVKAEARKILIAARPELALQVKIEMLPRDIRKIIKERGLLHGLTD